MEARSRRPASSPTRVDAAVVAALESSGLNHGQSSVHDKMRSLGSVFDGGGIEIMRHSWPKPGPAYVSSGRLQDDTREPL